MAALTPQETKRLLPLLDELGGAVEDLVLTGLTTASEATRRKFDVAFKEASRMRLLRLSSTLRVANEELGRYTRKDPGFSAQRFAFFLNRAWLLSHGIARAIREDDPRTLERLLWAPTGEVVEELQVVVLGIVKKVVARTFCAFEFRLRTLEEAAALRKGAALSYSLVFPLKPGVEIPAEGYLHLPQKQKFKGIVFLEGKRLRITRGVVSHAGVTRRLSLTDESTVTAGDLFDDWERYATWDAKAALERIENHRTSPLDLEIEMQEEIVLSDWQLGAEKNSGAKDEQQARYPLLAQGMEFEAVVSTTEEGRALSDALAELAKRKQRPSLFGLVHYERCRPVLQPLATFAGEAMKYLTISEQKVDRAALLKALKF